MGIILTAPARQLAVLQYGRDEDGVSARYLRVAGGVDAGLAAYRLARPGRIRALGAQFAGPGSVHVEVRKLGDPTPLAMLAVEAAKGGEVSGLNVPVQAGDVLQVFLCDQGVVDITKPLPVDADTVATYAFDETGGTGFVDSSPNGLNGFVVGNPILGVASRLGFGRAIEFPGSNSSTSDYATVPDSPLFDIPVGTVECFIKLDALSGRPCPVSRDASGQGEPGHFSIFVNSNGSVSARLQNLTQSVTVTTPAGLIQTGQWHHLAGVFGGPTGLELYVDGVRQASDLTITSGLEPNTEPWVFGARNQRSATGSPTPLASNSHMDGLLDDVRISKVRRNYVGVGVNRPVAVVYVEHP